MEIDEIYCKECGSCGVDGCCPSIACAKKNMVENGCGLHCSNNFKEVEFYYCLGKELYDKYQDEEIFNNVFNSVFLEEGEENV